MNTSRLLVHNLATTFLIIPALVIALSGCSSPPPKSSGGESWKAYRVWPTLSKTRGKVGELFKAQLGWRNTKNRPSFIENPEFFIARVLPQGLAFDGKKGVIFGTPAEPGRFSIRFGVRDKNKGTHGLAKWYQDSITLEIKKFNDLR